MWIAILMGLRNIRRRLSRTLLTVSMLAFGTLMLVFVIGLNEGTYKDMIRMSTTTWNGQFQVLNQDYNDSPSLYESVENSDKIMEQLRAVSGVKAVTARVETAGLFSVDNRTAGGQLTGVIPEHEKEVASLVGTISEGSFLGKTKDPEALPIVLGDGLAKRLKVKLHGEVVFMGQGADGSTAAELYEVVGLIDSGIHEMDASMAFIRLSDAQELLVLGDKVHRIVGRVESERVLSGLDAKVDLPEGDVLQTWEQIMPEVSRGIEQDREGSVVILYIILFMVVLGIVNTLMMSVYERTREFGVMKALGTPGWQIILVVICEGAWLAILGVGLGTLLGTLLILSLQDVGLQMLDQPVEFAGMQILKIYPANTMLGNVTYPVIIAVSSVLGSIWPAWRASRLDPITALREF